MDRMSAYDAPSAAVDSDIIETREWIDSFDAVIGAQDSTRALFLLRRLEEHAGARPACCISSLLGLSQYDFARASRTVPRRSGARRAPDLDHALECAGHGDSRQQSLWRARRSYRELRLGGRDLRNRLQSFLPGCECRPRGRSGVLPAPLCTRHLCPRLPRGSLERRAACQLSSGSQRRRIVLISAPM